MAGKLAEALVRAGVLAADAYDIEEELGLRKDNSVNLTATLSDGGSAKNQATMIGVDVAASATTGHRTSDAVISATTSIAPLTITQPITLNRVSGYCAVAQAGALVEIGLYKQDRSLVTRTGVRELGPVGAFEFSHPEVTLDPGVYFYAVSCTGTTAQIAMTDSGGGYTAAAAVPLADPLPTITPSFKYPALIGKTPMAKKVVNFEDLSNPRYRVYGQDAAATKVFAIDTTAFKLVYTTNGGESWVQMMSYPSPPDGFYIDMIADSTSLYMLTMKGRLYKTSGFTASDTVTEISAPVAPGFRRANTSARQYCLCIFNDYLYQGEYSQAGAELPNDPSDPSGPRIWKYGPLSGTPTWSLSKQFSGARHVHSFFAEGALRMWVSLGDTGSGNEIGFWRLAGADVATDNWQRWTTPVAPNTAHYCTDMVSAGGYGAPAGLYGAGDNAGNAVTHTYITGGTLGSYNVDKQLPTPAGQPSTETSRSIAYDFASKNLYWFTAETTDPALYMSYPPYSESVRVCSLNVSQINRACVQNGYLMQFDKRFKLPKMPWQ